VLDEPGIRSLPRRGDEDGLALDNSSVFHWWRGDSIFPTTHMIRPGFKEKRKQGGIVVQTVHTVKPINLWSIYDCEKVFSQEKKLQCVMRVVEDGVRWINPIKEEETTAMLDYSSSVVGSLEDY
jgi:hypothetical protein